MTLSVANDSEKATSALAHACWERERGDRERDRAERAMDSNRL